MSDDAEIARAFHLLDGLENFSITRKGNRRYFGPASPTKVKFRQGLLQRGGVLKRTFELVADGKSDYAVDRIVGDEEARRPGLPFIRKVRAVIEGEIGRPLKCRCGLLANHQEECSFKIEPLVRNRALDAEAARSIRGEYDGGRTTMTALAIKWHVRIGTISDIVKGLTHCAFPLPLGRFKGREVERLLKVQRGCLQRLQDGRTFHAHGGREDELAFDRDTAACAEHLDQAIECLARACRAGGRA